jgi:predicted ester cyclase
MSNAAVVNKFFETYGKQHDVEGCDPLFAESMTVSTTAGPGALDKQGYKQLGYVFLAGFPDMNVEVLEQYEVGDRVITCVEWSGTHTGALMSIPPTGRSFRSTAIFIDRISGGLIAERREVSDMLGMMQQLGLVPALQGS